MEGTSTKFWISSRYKSSNEIENNIFNIRQEKFFEKHGEKKHSLWSSKLLVYVVSNSKINGVHEPWPNGNGFFRKRWKELLVFRLSITSRFNINYVSNKNRYKIVSWPSNLNEIQRILIWLATYSSFLWLGKPVVFPKLNILGKEYRKMLTRRETIKCFSFRFYKIFLLVSFE